MHNLLLRFSENLFGSIVKLLQELGLEINEETIHSIRVELKKVRFLAVLVQDYAPGIKLKKAYKPFKALFKETGKIRGEWVKQYRKQQVEQGSEKECATISKKESKLRIKLADRAQSHLDSIQKGILLFKRKLEQFPDIAPQEFVRDISKQFLQRLTPNVPKRKLHRCRHLIKGILYACDISPQIGKGIRKQFNIILLQQLEDAIGDWHDLSLLLQWNKKANSLTSAGLKEAKAAKKRKLEFIYQAITVIQKRKP